jgi:DNA-binding MarR family transcriptional regulator
MDAEQLNVEMQKLVADVFETAGALRREGEEIAGLTGQTQARWQVMWTAAAGTLTVAMIARRLGLARQSVQRTADVIVAEDLASFEPNPDHRRSPLLALTPSGRGVLDAINEAGRERNLRHAAALGEDGIAEFRRLLQSYRDSLQG